MQASHSNTGNNTQPKQRARRPNVPQANPEPTMHLARRDYWCDVKCKGLESGASQVFSSATFPNALKKVANLFEIYVIHSATIIYKPLISDYKSGNIIVGVDYATKSVSATTSASVAAHKHFNVRISKEGKLPVKVPGTERYTTVSDQNRDAPFAAVWYINFPDGKASEEVTVGQLYLDYDVTFRGMTA